LPVISREPRHSGVRIVLYGQLAPVMALAESKNNVDKKGRLSCVAGARNCLELLLITRLDVLRPASNHGNTVSGGVNLRPAHAV